MSLLRRASDRRKQPAARLLRGVEWLEQRAMLAADLFEPNNSKAIVDASPFGALNSPNLGVVTGTRTISGLTLDDPADFFKFSTATTGGLFNQISINFVGSQGNLALSLLDGAGNVLLTSDGPFNTETVSLTNLSAGVYYVRVTGTVPVGGLGYTLAFNTPNAPSGFIPPDAFEDDDSTSIVNARVPGDPNSPNLGAVSGTRTITGLTMQDAADWFRFQTTTTGTAADAVSINFNFAQGDLDFNLIDVNGNILASTSGTSNTKSISLSGLAADTYFVQVFGVNGATNPNYTLTVNAPGTGGGGVVPPDAFEPNDSPAQVAARPPGGVNSPNLGTLTNPRTISGLTLGDMADWFEFRTLTTGRANSQVSVVFSDVQGTVGVNLTDANGVVLATSAVVGNAATISLIGRPAGFYFVQVFGVDGATSLNYTLTIVPPVPARAIPADRFELNTTKAQVDARPAGATNSPNLGVLTQTRVIQALTMNDAADWFRFQTLGTGTSSDFVRIDFSNALGNLGLNLRDADGNIVATSDGTGDSETISLAGVGPGVHYVEVFGQTNPSYTLTIDPFTVPADTFEPNDTRIAVARSAAGAANSPNLGVLSGTRTLTSLSLDDAADWFRFQTVARGTAADSVTINFSNAQGNLALQLTNARGRVIATSNGTGDTESISLAGRPAGVYFIRVFSPGGGFNPDYSLTIDAPQLPPADAFENNDTRAAVDAAVAGAANSPNLGPLNGARTISNLTMEDSADWFRFQTTVTGTNADFVRINFSAAQGSLGLRLRNANGAVLATKTAVGDSETISLFRRRPGVYYVQVFGINGDTNPDYSLTIDAPSATLAAAALASVIPQTTGSTPSQRASLTDAALAEDLLHPV